MSEINGATGFVYPKTGENYPKEVLRNEIPQDLSNQLLRFLEWFGMGQSKECRKCRQRYGWEKFNLSVCPNGAVRWPDYCAACGTAMIQLRKMKSLEKAPAGYATKSKWNKAEEKMRIRMKMKAKRKTKNLPPLNTPFDQLEFMLSRLVTLASDMQKCRQMGMRTKNWVPYKKCQNSLEKLKDELLKRTQMKEGSEVK